MSLTKATYSMVDGAVLNVLDYGAVNDGITDCTTAVQNAVNVAMQEGKQVFFPAGDYLITDTINFLNSNWLKAFGLYGENPMSTVIKFSNSTINKNLFNCEGNINYLVFSDLGFQDVNARTSRCFYMVDNSSSPGFPAWKHLFRNVFIRSFKEGVRFDGGATAAEDTHQSEVMFLHSKIRNCETSLIYNNIQSVNHQLIGFDIENDDSGDVLGKWKMIKFERGSYVNHVGGSVIGYGPYVWYEYPASTGVNFQGTAQFSSINVRLEGRGNGPFIEQSSSSNITLSHQFRLLFQGFAVSNTGGVNPVLAQFGGRTFVDFRDCIANVSMTVDAYMTSLLSANAEYGNIRFQNCQSIIYNRISTVAAFGGTGVLSSNDRAIPSELSAITAGSPGANDGSGYFTLRNFRYTIYSGGWQSAQLNTLTYANLDDGGFGPGVNPATMLVNLPVNGRLCKFRLLRDRINSFDPFQLVLIVVVAGVDYTVATITPTAGTGGHFEADIQTATGMTYFINDGVNWDGKMKVVKSGSVNGYVGLIMVDYM